MWFANSAVSSPFRGLTLAGMARYFFDSRDGDKFVIDDERMEFVTLEEARDEATEALADMAHDAIPGSIRRELAIEVRDGDGEAVLRASLWCEVQTLT